MLSFFSFIALICIIVFVSLISSRTYLLLTEIRDAREQFYRQMERQNKMIFDEIMLLTKAIKGIEINKTT